jgi:uncharacterized membrane protein YphA (DoxX/SURF4 family)
VKLWTTLTKTDTDPNTILIRFIVGYVFVTEGIQKFLYSEVLGTGRFVRIGIPHADIMAPLVGVFEIFFGSFILVGFATRLAAIPQMVIMVVALATTKWSWIHEKGWLTFSHEARNDLLMLFCLIFLFKKGSGGFSIDGKASLDPGGLRETD